MKLASEAAHWYLPNGNPFYTVPRADGKGDRPANLGDARKVNAVPSVTTVTKIIEKPQLNNYFETGIFDAAMNLEWKAGDDRKKLFSQAREASRRPGRQAAERGDLLHANIEEYLNTGRPLDEKWTKHCENVLEAMINLGFKPEAAFAEHTFVHCRGYGGKIDYHEPLRIADFKSKDRIDPKKQYAYTEHMLQLAAYREGIANKTSVDSRNFTCYNFFVGVDDYQVLPHKWKEEEMEKGYKMFVHLLEYWKLDRNYDPSIFNE